MKLDDYRSGWQQYKLMNALSPLPEAEILQCLDQQEPRIKGRSLRSRSFSVYSFSLILLIAFIQSC